MRTVFVLLLVAFAVASQHQDGVKTVPLSIDDPLLTIVDRDTELNILGLLTKQTNLFTALHNQTHDCAKRAWVAGLGVGTVFTMFLDLSSTNKTHVSPMFKESIQVQRHILHKQTSVIGEMAVERMILDRLTRPGEGRDVALAMMDKTHFYMIERLFI